MYRGKIRPWGKTKKSLGVIHVPKRLANDLWLGKQECPDSSPEAFIFPNQKGRLMDGNNYRKRVLHKLASELELSKLTFQVIRRTIATLAQKKGTVKDVKVYSGTAIQQQQRMFTCGRFRKASSIRSTRFMQNSERSRNQCEPAKLSENLLPNATNRRKEVLVSY